MCGIRIRGPSHYSHDHDEEDKRPYGRSAHGGVICHCGEFLLGVERRGIHRSIRASTRGKKLARLELHVSQRRRRMDAFDLTGDQLHQKSSRLGRKFIDFKLSIVIGVGSFGCSTMAEYSSLVSVPLPNRERERPSAIVVQEMTESVKQFGRVRRRNSYPLIALDV
jgi:hypothetical protein